MAEFKLETRDHRNAFAPGERIDGIAGWDLAEPAKWVEVRLFYRTAGKGDEDAAIVDSQRFEQPPPVDAQAFEFTAPDGPLSYEGRLIELRWGLELVAHRVKKSEVLQLTLTADRAAGRP